MNEDLIRVMLSPPDLFTCKRVLAIQPHPDDNEVGIGGIIARLTQAGIQVDYLTVTTGDLGSRTILPEELMQIRAKEVLASGSLLGVENYRSCGLPDRMSLSEQELTCKILPYIRELRPDGVLVPDPWLPYEGHTDHRLTGLAATAAFMAAGATNFPRGEQVIAWEPKMIGYYFTAAPNTIVDVTETFDLQFQAMACHESQMNAQTLTLYRWWFFKKGRELAQGKGFALGQGLKMLSPLHIHCFTDAQLI